jgi:hypothetical protein
MQTKIITMMKTLLLITPLLAAAQDGYETVSEGLIFSSDDEPQHQLDRSDILSEIQGGRPLTRRLRRVKKVNVDAKEAARDLDVNLVG